MSRWHERQISDLTSRLDKISIPERATDEFLKYRDDPVGFCVDVLGVESAYRRSDGGKYQWEILRDLAEFDRVGVRSGHGTGKTCLDSWAIIWFLITRPLSRVIVLAPEFTRQVAGIVFSECRKWANRAKVKLPLEVMRAKIKVEGAGDEWSAQGMSSAGESARIEGWHSEGGLLLLVDEMKGVNAESFDAVQGALTGPDAKVLVTSVPGGAGLGPFWNIFDRGGKRWKLHHLSSIDSSVVSEDWVEEHREMWGEGTPLYETRVLGKFADVGEGILFSIELIQSAQERKKEWDKQQSDEKITLGVDVARSIAGDLNAIAIAQGGVIKRVVTFHEADTMKVVDRVQQIVSETGAKLIRVDVGGVGAGVVDRLKQQHYKVQGVAFGGGADDPQRFKNLRAEMYWNLRERMERGVVGLPYKLPGAEMILADLSAQRYIFTQDGKIQLESKDDTRIRAGHSPDRSDAIALAIGISSRQRTIITSPVPAMLQTNYWHVE